MYKICHLVRQYGTHHLLHGRARVDSPVGHLQGKAEIEEEVVVEVLLHWQMHVHYQIQV